MKKLAFIIETIALIASIVWYYFQPGYEPIITALIIIASLIGTYFIKDKSVSSVISLQAQRNENSNSIVINNIVGIEKPNNLLPNESNNKLSKRILFIDDEKFPLIGILKQAGWIHTKWIKDVIDLDNVDVKASDIIFIDINGVGKTLYPKDQGLGLASALKIKYKEKSIVVYSAESHRVHKAYSIVDACLPKDADPYEFIEIINDFSSQ